MSDFISYYSFVDSCSLTKPTTIGFERLIICLLIGISSFIKALNFHNIVRQTQLQTIVKGALRDQC